MARLVPERPREFGLPARFGILPFEVRTNNGLSFALLNGPYTSPREVASLFFLISSFVAFLGLLLATVCCETQGTASSGPEVSVLCLLLLSLLASSACGLAELFPHCGSSVPRLTGYQP